MYISFLMYGRLLILWSIILNRTLFVFWFYVSNFKKYFFLWSKSLVENVAGHIACHILNFFAIMRRQKIQK